MNFWRCYFLPGLCGLVVIHLLSGLKNRAKFVLKLTGTIEREAPISNNKVVKTLSSNFLTLCRHEFPLSLFFARQNCYARFSKEEFAKMKNHKSQKITKVLLIANSWIVQYCLTLVMLRGCISKVLSKKIYWTIPS